MFTPQQTHLPAYLRPSAVCRFFLASLWLMLSVTPMAWANDVSPISSYVESFETSSLPAGWRLPPPYQFGFEAVNCPCTQGTRALKSMAFIEGQEAAIEFAGDFAAGILTFDYLPTWEHDEGFSVFVDDKPLALDEGAVSWINHSGQQAWHRLSIRLSKGQHDIFFHFKRLSHGITDITIDQLTFFADEADSDNDGLPDSWEYQHGLDYNDPQDATADNDSDGLVNLDEYRLGADPHNPNSDGDGLTDGEEVSNSFTDPTLYDTDSDGFDDHWEHLNGFDPLIINLQNTDSDGDGFSDFNEYQLSTSPLDATAQPPLITQLSHQFETDVLPVGWQVIKYRLDSKLATNGNWTVTDDSNGSHDNSRYLLAQAIRDSAEIQYVGYFSAGKLSFKLKMIPSNSVQYVELFVDGQLANSYHSEQWANYEIDLSAGVHQLTWRYVNLFSNGDTLQGAALDSVEFSQKTASTNYVLRPSPSSTSGHDNHSTAAFSPWRMVTNAQHTRPYPYIWDLAAITAGSTANKASQEYRYNPDFSPSPALSYYTPSFSDGVLPDGWHTPPGYRDWVIWPDSGQRGSLNCQYDPNGGAACAVQWTGYLEAGTLMFDRRQAQGVINFTVNGKIHPLGNAKSTAKLALAKGAYTLRWAFLGEKPGLGFISEAIVNNVRYFATNLDNDQDGIPDEWEYLQQLPIDSDNSNTDADGDGLTDLREYQLGTLIDNADSDHDGLSDGDEVDTHHTDPLGTDSDRDGLYDLWEIAHQLEPMTPNSELDSDNDGFIDAQEIAVGTDPFDPDEMPSAIDSTVYFLEGITELGLGWQVLPESDVNWTLEPSQDYLQSDILAQGQRSVLQLAGLFSEGEFSYSRSKWPNNHQLLLDSVPVFENLVNDTGIVKVNLSAGFHTLKWVIRAAVLTQQEIRLSEVQFLFGDANYDSDGDGIPDRWEHGHGLDFNNSADGLLDPDNDGLSNYEEYLAGTDITNSDTDYDGIPDGWELSMGLDPNQRNDDKDSDNDGFSDLLEYRLLTSPLDADSVPVAQERYQQSFESGQTPPGWQLYGDLSFDNTSSSDGDFSLTSQLNQGGNAITYQYTKAGYISFKFKASYQWDSYFGFSIDGELQRLPPSVGQQWVVAYYPLNEGIHRLQWSFSENANIQWWLDDIHFSVIPPADSDGDGIPDYWELQQGLDPLDSNDGLGDLDQDGLSTAQEYLRGTNFRNPDSDNDILPDGWEVEYGLNPLASYDAGEDADHDGFINRDEYYLQTSPQDPLAIPEPVNYLHESFESGRIPAHWYASGHWEVTPNTATDGEHSLFNQTRANSYLKSKLYVNEGYLSFAFQRVGQPTIFNLMIDGQAVELPENPAGQWTEVQILLSQGIHSLDWSYFPNNTTDRIWLDNIHFSTGDIDNDGVPDEDDVFPHDPTETLDTDGDGIGNNADMDDDGDGVADSEDALPLNPAETLDTDGDGIGNNADTDDDGDGVADRDDAFPLDPTETQDLDGDGIGNNSDSDADGDGFSNIEEINRASNPLNKASVPASLEWLKLLL